MRLARLVRRAALLWFACMIVAALWSAWELRQAERSLGGLARAPLAGSLHGAAGPLRRAQASLHRASGLLGSPLFLPLRLLPGIGPDVAQVARITDAGERAIGSARDLLAAADTLRPHNSCIPVDRLDTAATTATRAATRIRATGTAIARHAFLGVLDRRLARTRVVVARLDRTLARGLSGIRLARSVLSGDRTALLVVPTPAEARGSGGVIGSFVQVTIERGCVVFGRTGRTTELNTQGLPAEQRVLPGDPAFVARYSRFAAASTWQNLTMSPDFPSVGRAITGLYPQSGGVPIDLVISLDPVALAGILEAVGPVTVAGWPRPITSANAVAVLQHDLYATVVNESANLERIAVLSRVVDAVRERVLAGADAPSLAVALAEATTDRHLQLWSGRVAEQAAIERLGASGRLTPLDGDALTLVTTNATASKLEWFLHRDMKVRVHMDVATGEVTSTVEVRLHNAAPSSGESDYIIGNDVGLPTGTSRLYVSLYSPLDLVTATVAGTRVEADEENELDRYVYSLWVDIAPGATLESTFTLRGRIRPGRYRLRVEQPPMLRRDRVQVDVTPRGRPTQRVHRDETRLLVVAG